MSRVGRLTLACLTLVACDAAPADPRDSATFSARDVGKADHLDALADLGEVTWPASLGEAPWSVPMGEVLGDLARRRADDDRASGYVGLVTAMFARTPVPASETVLFDWSATMLSPTPLSPELLVHLVALADDDKAYGHLVDAIRSPPIHDAGARAVITAATESGDATLLLEVAQVLYRHRGVSPALACRLGMFLLDPLRSELAPAYAEGRLASPRECDDPLAYLEALLASPSARARALTADLLAPFAAPRDLRHRVGSVLLADPHIFARAVAGRFFWTDSEAIDEVAQARQVEWFYTLGKETLRIATYGREGERMYAEWPAGFSISLGEHLASFIGAALEEAPPDVTAWPFLDAALDLLDFGDMAATIVTHLERGARYDPAQRLQWLVLAYDAASRTDGLTTKLRVLAAAIVRQVIAHPELVAHAEPFFVRLVGASAWPAHRDAVLGGEPAARLDAMITIALANRWSGGEGALEQIIRSGEVGPRGRAILDAHADHRALARLLLAWLDAGGDVATARAHFERRVRRQPGAPAGAYWETMADHGFYERAPVFFERLGYTPTEAAAEVVRMLSRPGVREAWFSFLDGGWTPAPQGHYEIEIAFEPLVSETRDVGPQLLAVLAHPGVPARARREALLGLALKPDGRVHVRALQWFLATGVDRRLVDRMVTALLRDNVSQGSGWCAGWVFHLADLRGLPPAPDYATLASERLRARARAHVGGAPLTVDDVIRRHTELDAWFLRDLAAARAARRSLVRSGAAPQLMVGPTDGAARTNFAAIAELEVELAAGRSYDALASRFRDTVPLAWGFADRARRSSTEGDALAVLLAHTGPQVTSSGILASLPLRLLGRVAIPEARRREAMAWQLAIGAGHVGDPTLARMLVQSDLDDLSFAAPHLAERVQRLRMVPVVWAHGEADDLHLVLSDPRMPGEDAVELVWRLCSAADRDMLMSRPLESDTWRRWSWISAAVDAVVERSDIPIARKAELIAALDLVFGS